MKLLKKPLAGLVNKAFVRGNCQRWLAGSYPPSSPRRTFPGECERSLPYKTLGCDGPETALSLPRGSSWRSGPTSIPLLFIIRLTDEHWRTTFSRTVKNKNTTVSVLHIASQVRAEKVHVCLSTWEIPNKILRNTGVQHLQFRNT